MEGQKDEWMEGIEGAEGGQRVGIQALALVVWLGGWVCPAAIRRNGPRLRKPWRSGIKVCVCVCSFCIHLCMCGSVAAGRLYTKYRAGGGEGVWQRIRLRIGLHALGYRERTTGLGWALHC